MGPLVTVADCRWQLSVLQRNCFDLFRWVIGPYRFFIDVDCCFGLIDFFYLEPNLKIAFLIAISYCTAAGRFCTCCGTCINKLKTKSS